MHGCSHILSIGASTLNTLPGTFNNDLNTMQSTITTGDDTEVDTLNDETFGDCDLDALKIKSDFGDNGEFLGENLPDFFNTTDDNDIALNDNINDQSQQLSIDALLGEDPLRSPSISMNLRQLPTNPLFNMAISQAPHENIFLQHESPHQSPVQLPQQINYQLLKQFEQILIHQQIPAQERIVYMQVMIEKMQRDAVDTQQAPPIYSQRQQQAEDTRSMAVGEMMERARLSAMNTNSSRSQSPLISQTNMSSQFMDAIQRSNQIPVVDNRTQQSSSSPHDTIISSSSPSHHHGQTRQHRPARHYPRPPLLNTWQGRGFHHDEFAGMMSDREKQWVVKIQLHQAKQTEEEDYYFHKWSQQKHGNQSNRQHHRGQKLSYPVHQLLKSIQQEKELADRLSQTSLQATFSNVNPTQPIPYATPIVTAQLGKQSIATPRHPRCILHLDGQFTVSTRADAITHNKYDLGLLLNIENLHRDILQLDYILPSTIAKPNNTQTESINGTSQFSTTAGASQQLLESIIDRYFNHETYLFADMFGQFKKGQMILERLYSYLTTSKTNYLGLILIRLYGSLCYMVRRWPTKFHIQPMIMNIISLMQQQINSEKTTFEQSLPQVYIYYNEKIKPKILEFDTAAATSPFSHPALFTNSQTVTILIEILFILERQCYLLPNAKSSTLPIQIMQKLQPQLQYQLSEPVRLLISDLCQALIACSSPTYTPKKMLKPFAQIQQQQFSLLCKFLRIQTTQQTYASMEPKLIYCCIKDS